jgi:hypothetical protein
VKLSRFVWAAATAAVFLAAVASPALARSAHRIAGVLRDVPTGARVAPRAHAATAITYGGGSVMHSNRTHLIFWTPSGSGLGFDPAYETLIATFLTQVAADSHKPTNLYGLTGQYADSGGPAAYDSAYAGAYVDTNPLPAQICHEPLGPPLGKGPGWNNCVTDSQIMAELSTFVGANQLPANNLRDIYFLVLPNGLGACFDSGPSDCADGGYQNNGWCGYHSSTAFPGVVYAVIPYNAIPGHCQSDNPRPNSSAADPTISTLAHEHAETITDPDGNEWIRSGTEIGDSPCDTIYGPNLGGSSGATAYNQSIAGGHYFIQDLWSNQAGRCSSYPQPDRVSIGAPRRGTRNRPVKFVARAIDPQGRIVGYRWAFGDGKGGWRAQPTHVFGTLGTFAVNLKVIDSWGNWAYASRPITIGAPLKRR